MKQNKKPTKDNTFEIDITPSWGYVAKSLLALIQINYKADVNKADYKALKEQLTQMSQVADAHVKEHRQTMTLANKIEDYRSFILDQFEYDPPQKGSMSIWVLKGTRPTQRVYVDHLVYSDGTDEYDVWTFDTTSHYKAGTYKTLQIALEEAIIVSEKMKGVK